jgi:hypothetical protein
MIPLPVLDPVLGHTAAASLGALLLLGAADKLRDAARFRAVVDDYALLPAALVPAFALALPLAEALAGVLLLPGATRGFGALLAAAVLLLATAAVAINLRRGRTAIDCGCGGAAHTPLSAGLLARNGVLLLAAAAAALPVAVRTTVWLDLAAVGCATLFGLGLYLVANTLLGQHGRLLALRNAP